MTTTLRRFASAIAAIIVTIQTHNAIACFSCGNPSTLGQQQDLCADPSAGLWNDMIGCLRSICARECADWLNTYDACVASGLPGCQFGAGSSACNDCTESSGAYAGIGCGPAAHACGADTTGCVTCSAWLGGGDGDNLCPNSIDAAIGANDCVCAGACSAACASACAGPYFESAAATFACGLCLPTSCSASYATCVSS